jgi:hypothetical protein
MKKLICYELVHKTVEKFENIGLTIVNGVITTFDCSKSSLVINDTTITAIGDNAFWNCSSLTSIELPNSLKMIGNGVFSNCSGLTSIKLPNSLKMIGNSAFSNCSGLTSILLPTSITMIGNGVFWKCSGLTRIDLSNSLTMIGNTAFYNCNGLTNLNLPNSITKIGNSAFSYCSNLTNIIFNGDINNITIDENAFESIGKIDSTINVYNIFWDDFRKKKFNLVSPNRQGTFEFYSLSLLTSTSTSTTTIPSSTSTTTIPTSTTTSTIPTSTSTIPISTSTIPTSTSTIPTETSTSTNKFKSISLVLGITQIDTNKVSISLDVLGKINSDIDKAIDTIIKSIYKGTSYDKTIDGDTLYVTIKNQSENFKTEYFYSTINNVIFIFKNSNQDDINKLLKMDINKFKSNNYLLYIIIFIVLLIILLSVIFYMNKYKKI